jgi:putative ABC transport system permease protein
MNVNRFVLANLAHRPARTAASVLGIALGAVLILTTVGLAHGMLGSSGRREAQVGAEILFQSAGGFASGLTATPLALPVAYAAALTRVDGVAAVTPVGRYVRAGAGGLGFELVEGVAFTPAAGQTSYQEIAGIGLAEGRWPAASGELVIDRTRARSQHSPLGTTVEMLGRSFVVVGIYEPEVGARVKMPLAAMQALLGNDGRCSWLLVKTRAGSRVEDVAARIERSYPGNTIVYTRDIPGFYQRGFPSLAIFLDVVVALAIAISALITLLAMYTTVSERTRQIGILKSLGASKALIVLLIEREAVVLGVAGLVMGVAGAILARALITRLTPLVISFDATWLILAAVVAVAGSALGAAYPALRAAHRDAVEALAHE